MIDFAQATADDKEQTLGREFREIAVLAVDFSGGVMLTTVILSGEKLTLIGDPVAALLVHLGGRVAA